jgi:hypothetical protein
MSMTDVAMGGVSGAVPSAVHVAAVPEVQTA